MNSADLQPWPLVVTLEDVFVPVSSKWVREALVELEDAETRGGMFDAWAENAWSYAEWAVN